MDIETINGKRCLIFPVGDPLRITLRTMRADETMQKFMDEKPGRCGTEMTKRYGLGESTLTIMEQFGLLNIPVDSFFYDRVFSTTTRADEVIEAATGVEVVVFTDRVEFLD